MDSARAGFRLVVFGWRLVEVEKFEEVDTERPEGAAVVPFGFSAERLIEVEEEEYVESRANDRRRGRR